MSNSFFRGRIFGFEIQHIIPSEVWSSDSLAAEKARALLQSVDFKLESRSNKIALLISQAARNAMQSAPGTVKNALTGAGLQRS